MRAYILETERLLLRQWKKEDFPAFAALNGDPETMRYFPKLLSPAESDALAERLMSLIYSCGWGLWATELKSTGEFIGFVGLNKVKENMPFAPATEIGWRLIKAHWGKGYATEAGKRVLAFAFEELNLSEVVSFTVVDNHKSRSVMQRLGLVNTECNFLHPAIPKDSAFCEHVLYKTPPAQP